MGKKSDVPSSRAGSRSPIGPLQFLLALDQVTREDERGDDAVPEEVVLDFDEDAVTQPYGLPRGMLAAARSR